MAKQPKPKPKCIITFNGETYYMVVDDHGISFEGHDNARYFESHYKKAGYAVEMRNESVTNIYK